MVHSKWVSVILGKKIRLKFQKSLFGKMWFWFFFRNDAYSFLEIRFFFQKSHQNNWNIAKWIIFPEMTLPDFPNASGFFSRNDASSFPGFSAVIPFITWYLTLMTLRDLFYVTYSLGNWCSNGCIWRHKISVMYDVIKDWKVNFGFFFQRWRSWIFPKCSG